MRSAAKGYDVFISHASEDKDVIARPLAQKLAQLGLKVWFDEFTLQIGDKLRESIDRGLLNSNFGIVILSKSFFSKNWPKRELDGLMSLQTKILPIWHEVNSEDVIKFSPMLASIYALPSSYGINAIAQRLYKVITNMSSESDCVKVEEQYVSPFENLNDSPIREIQNKRFRFLLKLYQNRDRMGLKNNMFTIGAELGYPENITKEIVQYYREKTLLEHTFSGRGIEITVSGIDYVEQLIHNSPEVKTVKFNRDSFLVELYKERQSYWGIDMHELAKRLDIPNDSAIFDIIYYLEKKQLISLHYSRAKITTNGIDYVERHLSRS